MSNMIVMRNNAFDSATLALTTGTELANLPLTNTQFYSNSEIFRTPSLSNVQINIVFDAPSYVSGLVLWRHNLTASATIQWRGYASADLSGAPLFDTGAIPAIELKTLGDFQFGVEQLGANLFDNSQFIEKFTEIWLKNNGKLEPVAVQSQSIVINDATNSDGYIDIARLYNGLALSPSVNFSYGAQLAVEATNSDGVLTADGSYHTIESPTVRHAQLQLNWLNELERPVFTEFFRTVGSHQDFYLSLYPEFDGQKRRDYAFAAKCKAIPASTHQFYNNYQMPLSVREV